VSSIISWLGDGAEIVDPETSQSRADICVRCEFNKPGIALNSVAAEAVKRIIETKNKIGLNVKGEKSLGVCGICSCVLRLMIHEPQDQIRKQMTESEIKNTPPHCWKNHL
jgi:hypothetical protein